MSAEGCFYIDSFKSPRTKTGYSVSLKFSVAQHNRDTELFKSFIEYFGCGRLTTSRESVHFVITKSTDILGKILPFFVKHPIIGVKASDFEDFALAAELIENKAHLTEEGIMKVNSLKRGMNSGRVPNLENDVLQAGMPQLVPFYFLDQVLFSYVALLVLIYAFSKYILPRIVRLQLCRMYITKFHEGGSQTLLNRAYSSLE